MSGEDYPLLSVAEITKSYVKVANVSKSKRYGQKKKKNKESPEQTEQIPLSMPQRLPFSHTALRPNFRKLRNGFRKLNCFKGQEEDMPDMNVPRHKSIDIGVGLARRMSLFMFTKKTVCVHPYHPFTPNQTTRKFYVFSEDKH